MSDRVFCQNSGPYKLSELIKKLGIELSDFQDINIKSVTTLKDAGSNDITFLNNIKYISEFKSSKAGACIVPLDFSEESKNGTILIKVKNPYYIYACLIDIFYSYGKSYDSKIEASANISKSSKIGNNCYIGHNVVIEDEAEIGDDCVIKAGTVIGYKVKIGNRARIESNVSISYSIIGDDVVILPGAAIGQDGFGFATEKGVHKKIYHIGRVIIGNNVEIGANSTIDRGSVNDTIIEDLCRIDNLVQIGHNVHIKRGSIIVAQVGIAGSSKIGSYCALGGQVGVAGHVNITDNVQIAGQGGVIKDINEAGIMGGTPAVPIKDWHKQSIIMKNLVKGKNNDSRKN